MNDNWRPINTAPKDGNPIIGCDGFDYAVVKWCYNPLLDNGYWELMVCGTYAQSNEWNPTHWMPILGCIYH